MGSAPKQLLYLMNDFVVQPHVCNLRCAYCLNFENEFLGTQPWAPEARIDFSPESEGFERATRVLERLRVLGDAPILRIAGGEILALAGGIDFIETAADTWHRVQVLTNATLLEGETLDRLAAIPRLNLCVSVDGHTAALNHLRTPNQRWADRIVGGLDNAVAAGIPVEVYTVLTDHNVEALYDFAIYLRGLTRRADVRFLPFPVRGKIARKHAPSRQQLGALGRLLEGYDALSEILPPRVYLERLMAFLVGGTRTFRCRVPLSHLQTFEDGGLASCSNCWTSPLGNLLEEDGALHRVGEARIHRLFLRDPPRLPFCKGCLTPFDVANVYFEGQCSLVALGEMDLFSTPPVRERLAILGDAWRGARATAVWR